MPKILIAEDDPSNREIVVNCLMAANRDYSILNAVNGEMAVKIAAKKLPDLIIMDWEMPAMDGIEAIRRLKENESTRDIPVIMFTGVMTSSENLRTALEAGAIDFIRKPVDRIELIARVNSMLLLTRYFREKMQAEKRSNDMMKEKLTMELDYKNRELVAMTLESSSKNKMLEEISTRLKGIGEKEEADPVAIREVLSRISESTNTDRFWEQFSVHFSSVYTGFTDALMKKHPDLSKTELKFCCFLKMNLSSKEIAQVLNVTDDAVEKTRYRLRKKLELESQESLNHFIHSI